MSRETNEQRLAKTVIDAAAKELQRADKDTTILAQFRRALCASRDGIIMVSTLGDALPDEDEKMLASSVNLIWQLERAIDEVVGKDSKHAVS